MPYRYHGPPALIFTKLNIRPTPADNLINLFLGQSSFSLNFLLGLKFNLKVFSAQKHRGPVGTKRDKETYNTQLYAIRAITKQAQTQTMRGHHLPAFLLEVPHVLL